MQPSRIYLFIARQALIASLCNGLINGWKAWSGFEAGGTFFLTLDSISTGSSSVFGQAVGGAFVLGAIATLITFFTFRKSASKANIPLRLSLNFWPDFILLMLRHSIFAFGVLSIFATLLQRWAGSIPVGNVAATMITATISFAVSFSTGSSTMLRMVDLPNGSRIA